MGLDWVLVAPPRRGKAKELRALRARLKAMQEKDVPEEKVMRAARGLGKLEVDPCELLEAAPRIGVDETATQWLRGQWKAGKLGKKETWAAVSKRAHGQLVQELVRPKEAVPLVNGGASGAFDFRGQQLAFAEEIIGKALIEEAWLDHSAPKMLDYARRLEAAAARYGKKHLRVPKRISDRIALIDGAACWLRFWGERRFAYHAWF